ncbi:MAG: hypothetical protein K8F36_01795 [Melioribacteraceae bacterium]|nr:hypothetical protein [Melioribacteraceae bacterium]MCO6473169.1 hypothetical protein [Melioribacteraceae bacterium]MDD3557388.1 hypothetical protein [Melioribacteraceae bacterium]
MKKLLYLILLAGLLVTATSCDDDEYYYDSTPPEPPRNVTTYVGDNQVDILWDHNNEPDLAGYNVYFAWDYQGRYELIGSTENNFYIDYDAVNGDKYYYAVVAYDYNGNESELSYDVAYGAPRPEGRNVSVFDFRRYPENSGYDFSTYSILPYDYIDDEYSADFFFENYEGTLYLNVWYDTEIQDMGPTNDIYDITYAPIDGWVTMNPGDNVKYVKALPGHTYVIMTWDMHFAKIRISSVKQERMFFDWAYQTIQGEQQLKPKPKNEKRNIYELELKKNYN